MDLTPSNSLQPRKKILQVIAVKFGNVALYARRVKTNRTRFQSENSRRYSLTTEPIKNKIEAF